MQETLARRAKVFAEENLLFCFLALAAWWEPLFTGRALFYDVLYKLFFPNQEFLRRSVLSGVFPLWNPHIYSGVPFAANLQSAVFYPFTYVHLLLDFPSAVAFNVCAHTALAGAFMYALAKNMGLSKTAAAGSAVAFSLNGNFLLRFPFPSHFHSYVWLPLILLAGYKRDLTLSRACLWGGAALALQLFAGHPQYLLYSLIACAICAAAAEDRKRRLAVFAGAGAVFAVLAACQLLPTALLSLQSVRASGFGFDWAMADSIRPSEMLLMLAAPQWNAWFTPTSGDPHIVGFYFGPILLICAGLAFKQKPGRWVPFTVMAALGMLLSLGRYFPLYPWLFAHCPVFRSIRFPAQAMYLTCFGASILAGLGLESAAPRLRRWLPALAALDLLLFGWRGTVTVDPAVYRTAPPAAAWMRARARVDRILLTPRTRSHLSMTGRDETEAWLKFKNVLFPNFSMAYGLYAADGQEELRYGRYEKILDRIDQDPLSPWIDVFGVKYVLSLWGMPAKYPLAAKSTANVFLNPFAFPKAYVAYDSVHVPDGEVLDYVQRRGSQALLKSVVLSDSETESFPRGCPSLRCSARAAEYLSQSARVDVASPCPGWLVLTDAYDAGWRARVNGSPTAIHRVNFMQRGVRIPAGRSQVEFLYRPAWLAPVLAVSALGWLLTLLLLLRGSRPGEAVIVAR